MSFTAQREIERNQKRMAEEKRIKQIKQAVKDGVFGETKIASRMINLDHVKSASQCVAEKVGASMIRGKELSVDAKECLKPLTVADEDDDSSYPLAANVVLEAMRAILSSIAAEAGESFASDEGFIVYESQQSQAIFRSIALFVERELHLISVMESHRHLYSQAKAIANKPQYSADAKAIAVEAAFRGLSPFDQVSAFINQKSDYQMPEAVADAPRWFDPSAGESNEFLRIGGFIEKAIEECSEADQRFWSIATVTSYVDGRKDTKKFFVFADAERVSEEALREVAEARMKMPMSMEPIKWMDGVFGGFASNQEVKADRFIRGIHGDNGASVSDTVYGCINKLQSVGFVVNAFMLNAVEQLLVVLDPKHAKIGKFVAPIKGVHYSKSMRAKAALVAAQQYNDGASFWHPWNCDYRGRMYPLTTVLNVQSTDFEKSLIKVADAQPINDRSQFWLSVHIANCYGKDKLSLSKRVEWVNENLDLVQWAAAEPVQFLLNVARGSQECDDAFQFVAACEEFVAIFINEERNTTNLLVAVDASCSGIQILSGITHDADAGVLVNVTSHQDPDVKGDAYGAVAELAAQMLNGEVKAPKGVEGFAQFCYLLDRKLCKKVVMTLAYNSSPQSHSEYLKLALREAGFNEEAGNKELISALGKAIRAAISIKLPNVIAFQKWLNSAASGKAENDGDLRWVTPSGFEVIQRKNVWESIRLKTSLMGKKNGQILLQVKETDEVKACKHASCTMPNYVHSLDASVLHMAFADFSKPFALIHDSVMTTAADVDAAIDEYKRAYIKHFADGKMLEQLVAQFGAFAGAKVAVPTLGNLVIEDVLHSQFFLA